VRDHDVSGLTMSELERARRELAASLALARPGSPSGVPTLAHISAIDAELARRTTCTLLCSCGFATSDVGWMDGHLFNHPGHQRRDQPPRLPSPAPGQSG